MRDLSHGDGRLVVFEDDGRAGLGKAGVVEHAEKGDRARGSDGERLILPLARGQAGLLEGVGFDVDRDPVLAKGEDAGALAVLVGVAREGRVSVCTQARRAVAGRRCKINFGADIGGRDEVVEEVKSVPHVCARRGGAVAGQLLHGQGRNVKAQLTGVDEGNPTIFWYILMSAAARGVGSAGSSRSVWLWAVRGAKRGGGEKVVKRRSEHNNVTAHGEH